MSKYFRQVKKVSRVNLLVNSCAILLIIFSLVGGSKIATVSDNAVELT